MISSHIPTRMRIRGCGCNTSKGMMLLLLMLVASMSTSWARQFDQLFPETDLCMANDNADDSAPILEACDESKFPACDAATTLICYNRRPSRHLFHADNRQPIYYIDYRSVYCYPNTWRGCSSCTPGRYCKSELRCILQEENYPCAEWI